MTAQESVRTAHEIIQECYKGACDTASEHTEKLAREVLRKRPDLHEFVNAMGISLFTNHEGHNEYVFEIAEADELSEFLMEWDSTLKISGDPMRFTADGPKITKW